MAVNATSFSFHLASNIADNSSCTFAIFLALFLPWLLYVDWSFSKAICHGTSPTPHARPGCSFIPSAWLRTSSSLSGTKVLFATWACSACICLHQNLERRKQELEASNIVSSRNQSDVNRYRLVLRQCRDWLFFGWHQQITMDYVRMASGKICQTIQKRKD